MLGLHGLEWRLSCWVSRFCLCLFIGSTADANPVNPVCGRGWRQTLLLRGSVVPAKFFASGIQDSELLDCRRQTLPSRGSAVPTKLPASGDVYIRKNLYAECRVVSGTAMFQEVQGGCANRQHHPHCRPQSNPARSGQEPQTPGGTKCVFQVSMFEELVSLLQQEQVDDVNKETYCVDSID